MPAPTHVCSTEGVAGARLSARRLWWLAFALAALPGAVLAGRWLAGALGVNTLLALQHGTGRAALALLTATLAVTPARTVLAALSARLGRRTPEPGPLLAIRRMLGLWSFAYALAHLTLFMHFELGWNPAWLAEEVGEKPYLLAGAAASAILALLAATSSRAAHERLGQQWQRLHRLAYGAAALALLHWWWLVKPGIYTPLPYTVAVAALLAWRLVARPR